MNSLIRGLERTAQNRRDILRFSFTESSIAHHPLLAYPGIGLLPKTPNKPRFSRDHEMGDATVHEFRFEDAISWAHARRASLAGLVRNSSRPSPARAVDIENSMSLKVL